MRKGFVLLLAVGALALGAGGALAAPHAAATGVVHITAAKSGLRYMQKVVHARAGRITIVFRNLSTLRHDVRIEKGEQELGGTRAIGRGTARTVVTLRKGTYRFYCSVPGHEDAGMAGTLVVS